MSGKMKAIVMNAANSISLEEVDMPAPNNDEVLCSVQAVAICGSDIKFIQGDTIGSWPPYLPFILGHEWAGTVVDTGRNVKNLKIGDRVAGEAHSGCGFCENCKKGRYNLCLNYGNEDVGHRHYGHKSTGAYAQYGVFNNKSLTKLPDDISFAEGAILDAAGTGLHLIDQTGISAGGSVLVIGPGPIGMITAKIAKALGTSKVIMVGRGSRLKKASKLSADEVIDFEKEDVINRVMEMTDGIGADEVFECSGAKGTLNQAIQTARKGGTIGIVGMPSPGNMEEIDNRKLIIDEISIFGSRANPNVSARLLSMISSGLLDIKQFITHSFSFDDYEKAFDYFANRKDGALKVILEPNKQ
jgi:L-iditol 2-dehydrogenase